MREFFSPKKGELFKYKNGEIVEYYSMSMSSEWIFKGIDTGKMYYTKNPDDVEYLLDKKGLNLLMDLVLSLRDYDWCKELSEQIYKK